MAGKISEYLTIIGPHDRVSVGFSTEEVVPYAALVFKYVEYHFWVEAQLYSKETGKHICV